MAQTFRPGLEGLFPFRADTSGFLDALSDVD
jgi:hypothetical protein